MIHALTTHSKQICLPLITGTTFDTVYAYFNSRFVSFVAEGSFINKASKRLVVAFSERADYDVALVSNQPFGKVHAPPGTTHSHTPIVYQPANTLLGYDPTANPGNFFRVFWSCENLQTCTLQFLKDALTNNAIKYVSQHYTALSCLYFPRYTSITFDAKKNFVLFYVEDEAEWMKVLMVQCLILPNGDTTHVLRHVIGLAATGDPTWYKLWISNLQRNPITQTYVSYAKCQPTPSNIFIRSVRKWLRAAFGVLPEVISLYHEAETNQVANWGYIFMKSEVGVQRLLNAPADQRTIKKTTPNPRVVNFSIARSKKKPSNSKKDNNNNNAPSSSSAPSNGPSH